MMFCPACKEEYRDGFTTCADCGAGLVAELPSAPCPKTAQSTLVPVFETLAHDEIAIIKTALDAAGIFFHFAGESFTMGGVRPLPARLLVSSDQKEDVLEILRDLDCIS